MPSRKRIGGPPAPAPMPTSTTPEAGNDENGEPFMISSENAFEDDDDDVAQDLVAASQDNSAIDLSEHEAPEITGYTAVPQPDLDEDDDEYGSNAPVTGRPTSPPLWKEAHLHPNVPSLKVWKVTNSGRRESIGTIDAMSDEDEFIATFYDSMPNVGEGRADFVVRPVDNLGRDVMQEVALPSISENHLTLVRLRRRHEGNGDDRDQPPAWAQQPPPGPSLAELLQVARELSGPALEEARAARQEAREAREAATRETLAAHAAAAAAADRTATERIKLATHAAEATEGITERMLNNDAARSKSLLDGQQGIFAQMMALQNAAAEREREAYNRRLDEQRAAAERERRESDERRLKEQREYDERRTREQREYEQKIAREREEAAERRKREHDEMVEFRRREEAAENRRRDDERRREEERERAREREHQARLEDMRMRAENDKQHNERMAALAMKETKGNSAEGLIAQVTGLMKALNMDPADVFSKLQGGGIAETVIPTIEGAIDVAKQAMQSYVDMQRIKAENETALKSIDAQEKIASAQAAAGHLTLGGPVGGGTPAPVGGGSAGDLLGGGAGGAVTTQGPTTTQAAPQPGEITSKLSLETQSKARKGTADMVNAIRSSAPEAWNEHVSAALTMEFAILHYWRENSIRAALKEARADDALIDQLRDHPAMKNPLLNDVKFG